MALTTTDIAVFLGRRFRTDVSVRKLRQVCDALESTGSIDIERIGAYRAIRDSDLPTIVSELQRCGLIPSEEITACDYAPFNLDHLVSTEKRG